MFIIIIRVTQSCLSMFLFQPAVGLVSELVLMNKYDAFCFDKEHSYDKMSDFKVLTVK